MTKQQENAFKKLKKLKVGALFMKMGTGKTKVALELAEYNNCDLVLYITPFSTINNIKKEINKWNFKAKSLVVGYETISMSDDKYLKLLKKVENKKCFIIADESVFIKNDETKRFKRLCNLRKQCEYALILNGTPITKNEYDIYNQMYFLSPKIIGMSKEEFKANFFDRIEYKKKNEKRNVFYKFSEVNAEYLYQLIKPYIFECDLMFEKEESNIIKYIKYDGDAYYKIKKTKLKEFIKAGSLNDILNLLTKLNIISSTYLQKNKEVIKYVVNKQVIVFCNYLEEVNYYKQNLDCYIITGETPNSERSKIIDEFKKTKKPLVMTYGVGSYSLNLQFCNEIVYSSINFDYGKLEQSKHRIKRIGQKRDIIYTYFLTDLGITKLILECIQKKQLLNNLIKEKIEQGGYEWLKDI